MTVNTEITTLDLSIFVLMFDPDVDYAILFHDFLINVTHISAKCQTELTCCLDTYMDIIYGLAYMYVYPDM